MNLDYYLRKHSLTIPCKVEDAYLIREAILQAQVGYNLIATEEDEEENIINFEIHCPDSNFAAAYFTLAMCVSGQLVHKFVPNARK